MAEPDPLPPRTYEPLLMKPGERYLMPTIGAAVGALMTLAVLGIGCVMLYRTIELQQRGVVVYADVVAAQHGRHSFVKVHLPPPVDQTADLMTWSGAPRPGDVIAVRYDPASPTVAEQAGQWPWLTLSLLFSGAVFGAAGTWWQASRPWRRERYLQTHQAK